MISSLMTKEKTNVGYAYKLPRKLSMTNETNTTISGNCVSNDTITQWIDEALSIVKRYDYETSVMRWNWNNRFKTTMGRAFNYNEIELSKFLFDHSAVSEQRETVFHEVAHCLNYLWWRKMGHGQGWKDTMTILGYPNASYCHYNSVGKRPNIIVSCNSCNSKCRFGPNQFSKAKNGSKTYRCPKCKSALIPNVTAGVLT